MAKTLDNKAAKQRIMAKRKELGWSQTDLADKIGMSRASYNTAEGLHNLNIFFRPEQLINLKHVLKTTYEFLLEGKTPTIETSPEPTIENDTELLNEIKFLKDKISTQAELILALKENIELLKRSK